MKKHIGYWLKWWGWEQWSLIGVFFLYFKTLNTQEKNETEWSNELE
jgi:hypothetical protein